MVVAVRSVSFTEEYEEEFNYFIKKPNRSRYICELIREDIKRRKQKGVIDDED